MQLGPLLWNPASEFLLVAGPCIIESRQFCLDIAGSVRETAGKLGIPFVFKASFDKANRSSIKSFRGPGLEEGLAILAEVGRSLGLPVTTDVHEAGQCGAVGQVVDLLQIPAFLCRQTDLLLAAAQTGKAVNVKKGQFMAPWEMRNAVEKIREVRAQAEVLLTERGTSFGYNRLINDMTAIPQMQALAEPGVPVLFDATHSTQLPGALGSATGGQPQFTPVLARAATAAGANGLFVEVHPEPAKSRSDAATILDLKKLPALLESCLAVHEAVRRSGR